MQGINILHLEGRICSDSVEPLIDQLGDTTRHVMIVVDSRGGDLEDALRLIHAIDAAFSREIMVAFHISDRAEGAALLVVHNTQYVFADSRALVGNLAIRQDDHWEPTPDLKHRLYRGAAGHLMVDVQSWFPPWVYLHNTIGLHEGRLLNAEAAESQKLVSRVCSFRDSVGIFATVISDIVGR